MSAHCSRCRDWIFDEDGQCYGEEIPDGSGVWVCDNCLAEDSQDKLEPHAAKYLVMRKSKNPADNGLYVGTWASIRYEVCHVVDEVLHALPLDADWACRFCQWAHRLD